MCQWAISSGSSAGMKLWFRSSARCAVASKAMERTSRRDTHRGYDERRKIPSSGTGRVGRGPQAMRMVSRCSGCPPALVAALFFASALLGGSRAGAQAPELTYKVGDRIEIDTMMARDQA